VTHDAIVGSKFFWITQRVKEKLNAERTQSSIIAILRDMWLFRHFSEASRAYKLMNASHRAISSRCVSTITAAISYAMCVQRSHLRISASDSVTFSPPINRPRLLPRPNFLPEKKVGTRDFSDGANTELRLSRPTTLLVFLSGARIRKRMNEIKKWREKNRLIEIPYYSSYSFPQSLPQSAAKRRKAPKRAKLARSPDSRAARAYHTYHVFHADLRKVHLVYKIDANVRLRCSEKCTRIVANE